MTHVSRDSCHVTGDCPYELQRCRTASATPGLLTSGVSSQPPRPVSWSVLQTAVLLIRQLTDALYPE